MHNLFALRNIFLFLFTAVLLLNSCTKQEPEKLIIATAANMQFAMDKLVAAFSASTQIPCETVISSSGKLTAQIQAGAPFHVFVSADQKYPENLSRNGHTISQPKVYAYGRLVLWRISGNTPPKLTDLSGPSVQHIAIANPKTAPYGVAAEQALQNLVLLDSVRHKLVFGESVAQTNQFITSGAAEVGFTALSIVQSPTLQKQGQWTLVPEESYAPIAQAIVVLKSEPEMEKNAQAFVEFILSEPATEILGRFGYLASTKKE